MTNASMSSTSTTNYGSLARAFHWLTAILVLAAFILSEGGPASRVFRPDFKGTLTLHESLGMAVFCLTLLRALWRMFDNAPSPVPMPDWMHLASSLTHVLLYLLLILIPLTAILGSWLGGHPVSLYIFGDISGPASLSSAIGSTLLSLHTLLGDAIMWLAGFHAAAALYHHFFLNDDVLRSMLPQRWN